MNKEIEVIRAKLKENLETTKLKLRSKLDKDIQVKFDGKMSNIHRNLFIVLTIICLVRIWKQNIPLK